MISSSRPARTGAETVRRRRIDWIAWHVLSALVVFGVAAQVSFRIPLWELPPDRWTFLLGLALTHGVGALVLGQQSDRGAIGLALRAAITIAAAFGVFAFVLLAADTYRSDIILAVSVAVSLVLAWLFLALSDRARRLLLPVLALGVVALAAIGLSWHLTPIKRAVTGTDVSLHATTLYDLRLSISDRLIRSEVGGGSIQPLSAGFLIGAGDGVLYYMEQLMRADGPVVRRLPYQIPINHDAFRADVQNARKDYFRLGDILAVEDGPRLRIVASHHYWHSDSQCFGLRLSTAEAERESFLAGEAEVEWSTLFEAQPCLRIRNEMDTDEAPFSGHMLGGRLAAFDDHRVLLSVGDHSFDGFNAKRILSQDPESDYGKMILIDLDGGEYEFYSIGHRNPQGLHAAPDGRIWSTEHGPQGGDELNLVQRGSNYGWPYETYGVQYGQREWPLSTNPGRHTEYETPIFSWLPSIAVSNLITVDRDLFPAWQGDLLVASLSGRLLRLRHEDGRILYSESTFIGRRIRDLAEAHDGRIVLLFDGGGLGVLEPADAAGLRGSAADGALQFAVCTGCHQIGDGSAHGIGPDLKGFFGRDIATAPGFVYSRALESLSGKWTDDRLERFLADPNAVAPGTTMGFPGVPDSNDRVLLVRYLKTNS